MELTTFVPIESGGLESGWSLQSANKRMELTTFVPIESGGLESGDLESGRSEIGGFIFTHNSYFLH